MLASCIAQINAQLRLFSPNHSDISPHLTPLSLLSLCQLSLLSGAQTKDAGLLGGDDNVDRWWFRLQTTKTQPLSRLDSLVWWWWACCGGGNRWFWLLVSRSWVHDCGSANWVFWVGGIYGCLGCVRRSWWVGFWGSSITVVVGVLAVNGFSWVAYGSIEINGCFVLLMWEKQRDEWRERPRDVFNLILNLFYFIFS